MKGRIINYPFPVLFVGYVYIQYFEIREAEPEGLVELVLQLSWLERYTDNVEVGSSTLPGTTGGKKQVETKNRKFQQPKDNQQNNLTVVERLEIETS